MSTPEDASVLPSESLRTAATGFGKDVVVYGLATVLVQSVSILTTPVMTRIFTPAQYGVLELMTVGVALATVLFQSGIDSGAHRYFFEQPTHDYRSKVASTAVLTTGAVSVVIAGCVALLSGSIAKSLLSDTDYQPLVQGAAVSFVFIMTASSTRELFRLERRPSTYLASAVLAATIGGMGAVFFVTFFSAGLEGVYIGLGVGGAISLAFNFTRLRHLLRPHFSFPLLKKFIAYGAPLLIGGASIWALNVIDRVILLRYRPFGDVGIYAVSNRVANLLLLGVYAFTAAWPPVMLSLRQQDHNTEQALRARLLIYVPAGLASVGVGLALFSRELVRLVAGDAYVRGADAIPLLIAGVLFLATISVTTSPMVSQKKTRMIAQGATLAAVFNIAACFILIPAFGFMGAATATLLAFAFEAVYFFLRAQGLERTPYQWRRLVILFVMCCLYLPVGWLRIDSLSMALLIKVPIAISFPGLLLVLRVLSPSEVTRSIRGLVAGPPRDHS